VEPAAEMIVDASARHLVERLRHQRERLGISRATVNPQEDP